MRASRLLSLLMLLQQRGRLSAAAAAHVLEVSVRTIYRDVEALSVAGVPIYADSGRHGGISLHEGYRTRLTGLSLPEAAALGLAGARQAAQDLGLGAEAVAAQLKVSSSLPLEAALSAQRIAQRFHVDPVPWYHRRERLPQLVELAGAVWRDEHLKLRYQSWSGVSTQTVLPLGLVHKGGLWYLVASKGRGRGGVRCYRVSSIVSWSLSEGRGQRPKDFDLARFWEEWAVAFEAGLAPGRARVRISPEGRRILRAVMPSADEMVEATRGPPDAQGWVEAQFPVESAAYTARQLLRLGTEVLVLAPPELVSALRGEALAVWQLHAGMRAKPTGPPR